MGISGGGGSTVDVRENRALVGDCDGVNRVFLLPEVAIQDPPQRQVKVYHGGRRLQVTEYQVKESVPGGGYDTVELVFAPRSVSRLVADYYV
jgi:hypothetical protein